MRLQKDVLTLMGGGFTQDEARMLVFLATGPKSEAEIQNKLAWKQWNSEITKKSLYLKGLVRDEGGVYSLKIDLNDLLIRIGPHLSESEMRFMEAMKVIGPHRWVNSVDLTKILGIAQSSISTTAKRLKRLGLIRSSSFGYRLTDKKV